MVRIYILLSSQTNLTLLEMEIFWFSMLVSAKKYFRIGNLISTFCHVLRYNRNGAFYKLNSLHKFFINLKLGVTWSRFKIQNKMKLLPWQTNCQHSSYKIPLKPPLHCQSLFQLISEIIWSHNNNPFQKINQLLEPCFHWNIFYKFILSQNLKFNIRIISILSRRKAS